MQKIEFKNYPDTSTPLNAQNLNLLQENVENEINNISYKKLLASPISASSSGIITQNIENYTNYDFLIVEYSVYQSISSQTLMIPTYTISNTKHFYPTYFQKPDVYESVMITFPTQTQIKLEVDTISGWTKERLHLLSITGIKMNELN